jgi:hypothetical protein
LPADSNLPVSASFSIGSHRFSAHDIVPFRTEPMISRVPGRFPVRRRRAGLRLRGFARRSVAAPLCRRGHRRPAAVPVLASWITKGLSRLNMARHRSWLKMRFSGPRSGSAAMTCQGRFRLRHPLPSLPQQTAGSGFAVADTGQEPLEITAGVGQESFANRVKLFQDGIMSHRRCPPRIPRACRSRDPGSRVLPACDKRETRYGHWRYVGNSLSAGTVRHRRRPGPRGEHQAGLSRGSMSERPAR